jgi:LysM repeat protein
MKFVLVLLLFLQEYQALLEKAKRYKEEGKLLEARKILVELYKREDLKDLQKEALRRMMMQINKTLIFSKDDLSDALVYTVRRGDTLWSIARKYKRTVQEIKIVNGLKGDLIRPGQRLKILKGKFTIRIEKSSFKLYLLYEGSFVKEYSISIGGEKTPSGRFWIRTKQERPDWTYRDPKTRKNIIIRYGDPRNILGERWLGLNIAGYGIHGTNDESSIGKVLTQGCIRMRNPDVIELYNLVPIGTLVEILE